jgi:DNA-binding response OmpR family regulator
MRMLLIEDDPGSRKVLAISMRRHGYAVDAVGSASEAQGLVGMNPYDVMVVDVGLPEGPRAGLRFVQELRAQRLSTPVLFLSARGELDDRVDGLEVGGDDYLVKPCHMREIDARVRALVRRSKPVRQHVLCFADLEIDWESRAVRRAGRIVELTGKEYSVLELLASHPGKLFSRDEIIAKVWDEEFSSDDRLITVYVKTLRRKLGHGTIQTVRGVGYRFPGNATPS